MSRLSLETMAGQAADTADIASMAARLARDFRPFVRSPISFADARLTVLNGFHRRAQSFLHLVDRTVFGRARSPYRKLLAYAGCERGDLHTLVTREGLDGALRHLADQGVYVSVEEFKGRRPVIRGSARFAFTARDFDNPLSRACHYVVFTGGSGGRPTPVRRTLDSAAVTASAMALTLEAYGLRNRRNLIWNGGSPTHTFSMLKLGDSVERWYYPISPRPLLARASSLYLGGLARLAGVSLAMPAYCDLKEPEPIARWLIEQSQSNRPILVWTAMSSAVRIASAAAALGGSLAHVVFQGGSEPVSPARRRMVEHSGARVLVDYSSTELPSLSYGCPSGTSSDDVHLMQHLYALVERERALVDGGATASALLFTTLSLTAGKIAIDTELGDTAQVEQRDCGCLLGSLGFTTHLSEIQSFEKLSTEGTTFLRSNVLKIVEETLPAQFGGSPVDYQLVEEEAADTAARLVLRIDPAVGPLDEAAVRSVLLAGLRCGGIANKWQTRLIERAESIVVQRRPPLTTRSGKVLPFQHGTRGANPA
jgi:hypothetical protein